MEKDCIEQMQEIRKLQLLFKKHIMEKDCIEQMREIRKLQLLYNCY